MNEQSNIYLPHLMVIEKITHEAPGVKTFRLRFKDEKEGEAFRCLADDAARPLNIIPPRFAP
jgi:hypothetical protein